MRSFCQCVDKATFGSSKLRRDRWRGNDSLSAGGGELPRSLRDLRDLTQASGSCRSVAVSTPPQQRKAEPLGSLLQ